MANGPDGTSFLYRANAGFIAELYARYLADPASVDASWQPFFAGLADDPAAIRAERQGAPWGAGNGFADLADLADEDVADPAARARPAGAAETRAATLDTIRALMMIRAYRVRGHLMANLDPLGLEDRAYHPELDPRTYGFTDADMDRPIFLDDVLGMETATMTEILAIVQRTYCSTIGVEFMHIQYPEQKAWIQERIEGREREISFTDEGKRAILAKLTEAEGFERFLHRKYTGTKRFGVDGGEALIPAIEQVIKRGGHLGVEEIVIGMPHRGRLNVLANVMAKPYRAIFAEFQGSPAHVQDVQGSGDVKYHLGTSSDREFDGRRVHLSLTANPSHLEAVNPVVLGKVRAKQRQMDDEAERTKVLPLLMHGDAAFAGQGLVAECFGLSQLKGYRTGGTIHFVVNNQIGFTTSPKYSRSSPYPSDVAKMVQAPIFHVNGDDPESVVHAARVAIEFRQKFHADVVVDMFCYRRHGHNEGDEPAFTQPLMYRQIAGQPTARETYGRRLVAEGIVAADGPDSMESEFRARLDAEFAAAESYEINQADWFEGKWTGFETAREGARRGHTAVEIDELRDIGRRLTEIPDDFNPHRTVRRLLANRAQMVEGGAGIDWATAESLAFGSLLREGFPVRLSGQDSGRGTFSQRHSVLVDQETEAAHVPLNHLAPGQARYEVIDSMLSEAAVLGFEYGFSQAEPRALVLWEAQFGDFANGAQVIIDQFVASGEAKWLRMSGLVLLLPHGHEGQGPEHSSARLERFLQLCAEDNMQVVNCTTPASYFHVLRRQIHRRFRKPLVVMAPKSLLRHKMAVSTIGDLGPGSTFHRVLYDNEVRGPDADVQRVVLCSGKVYYDLRAARDERGLDDVFFLRLEQVFPFPDQALTEELGRFARADKVVWCQEEPKNMGAWFFVAPRLEQVLARIGAKVERPVYAGRPESAAPASGFHKAHLAQQAALIDDALSG